MNDLEGLLSSRPVDQLLIALPVKSQYVAIEYALAVCERVGVEAKYFPDIFTTSRARRALDADDDVPSMRVRHVADDHRMVIKRALDIVGAAVGLLVLSPVLLACMIAVKVTSKGPAIFAQERYGYNRRRFRLFKFRTMVQDAEALQAGLEDRNEAQGPVFKIKADPRITPVGRFMRRTSLDELPQLINVLKGDMSLVGPRPLAVRDVHRFDAAWLMRRFSVRPGLTCLWQVNGRSNTSFDEWVRLDLDYIDNWSLALDMRILLKTVPAVLSGSGAM
jgi:exopolysaccharide biosynthesis polyprenyl glycosylphosphotransferase